MNPLEICELAPILRFYPGWLSKLAKCFQTLNLKIGIGPMVKIRPKIFFHLHGDDIWNEQEVRLRDVFLLDFADFVAFEAYLGDNSRFSWFCDADFFSNEPNVFSNFGKKVGRQKKSTLNFTIGSVRFKVRLRG